MASLFVTAVIFTSSVAIAQRRGGGPPQSVKDATVDAIVKEGTENSQLEKLAHELMDGIGPRLVGSPKMKQANDWAVARYTGWGIIARNEKWGEWQVLQ